MRVMERGDCLALLRRSSTGQVAFTSRALPAIRSVAYSLDGEDVVLDTRSATLAERLDGQVVAFAVNRPGQDGPWGWSVVVTGLARRRRPGDASRPTPGSDVVLGGHSADTAVRITSALITGRCPAAVSPAPQDAVPASPDGSLPPALETC